MQRLASTQAETHTATDSLPGTAVPAEAAARRRGTGPRTAAGKAVAARNSLGHGIYALSPVVAGLESAEDWNLYRQAMLSSLAPLGMLEETLAERAILTAWRMRRITGYESSQILRLIDDQKEKDAADEQRLQRQQELLQWIVTADLSIFLSQDAAEWLIDRACNATLTAADRVPDRITADNDLDDYGEELPDPCSAGEFRSLLQRVAESRGASSADLLEAIRRELKEAQDAAQRKFAAYCHAQLLPDERTLGQVMRYEAHLSRLFHRDLHELERLRAARNGHPVAAPLVLDVDLAGAPDGATASN